MNFAEFSRTVIEGPDLRKRRSFGWLGGTLGRIVLNRPRPAARIAPRPGTSTGNDEE
jgi:hypothetical protein